MKKLNRIFLITAVFGFLLTSCASGAYFMSEEEISSKGYSMDGWKILKGGEEVGQLTTMEWELYKNNFYREISISTSFSTDEEMKEIARFVHVKFPDCKIEVNEDGGNSFPK